MFSKANLDREEWISLWNIYVKKGDHLDEEFRELILNHGISWIESNSDSPQALALALSLLADDKAYLSNEAANRLKDWAKARLSKNDIESAEWHSVWSIYVQHGENLELELQSKIASQGFDWLKMQDDTESFLLVFEECSSLVVNGVEYLDLLINWVKAKIRPR